MDERPCDECGRKEIEHRGSTGNITDADAAQLFALTVEEYERMVPLAPTGHAYRPAVRATRESTTQR